MSRAVIALLTDFGTRDHYVGAMKGVILGICPDAALVDISHDIPAHDVTAGALELAACYRYFPPGTIFLVVIDPGVGSERRAMAADTGDYRLVAPDNGVISVVLHEAPPKKVVELTERKYRRPTVSRTFEGRDRFAPAAGWLAKGVALASFGRSVGDWVTLDLPQPQVTPEGIDGQVVREDRFGNLITNIDRRIFDRIAQGGAILVRIGAHDVARVVNTYAEAVPGEICALFGSSDHLEIAVRGGSAAQALHETRGAVVSVRRA